MVITINAIMDYAVNIRVIEHNPLSKIGKAFRLKKRAKSDFTERAVARIFKRMERVELMGAIKAGIIISDHYDGAAFGGWRRSLE
jgi:hypothetical protein